MSKDDQRVLHAHRLVYLVQPLLVLVALVYVQLGCWQNLLACVVHLVVSDLARLLQQQKNKM